VDDERAGNLAAAFQSEAVYLYEVAGGGKQQTAVEGDSRKERLERVSTEWQACITHSISIWSISYYYCR
jgi:hypothetical protein